MNRKQFWAEKYDAKRFVQSTACSLGELRQIHELVDAHRQDALCKAYDALDASTNTGGFGSSLDGSSGIGVEDITEEALTGQLLENARKAAVENLKKQLQLEAEEKRLAEQKKHREKHKEKKQEGDGKPKKKAKAKAKPKGKSKSPKNSSKAPKETQMTKKVSKQSSQSEPSKNTREPSKNSSPKNAGTHLEVKQFDQLTSDAIQPGADEVLSVASEDELNGPLLQSSSFVDMTVSHIPSTVERSPSSKPAAKKAAGKKSVTGPIAIGAASRDSFSEREMSSKASLNTTRKLDYHPKRRTSGVSSPLK
jgi:hypothetical protein